MDKFTKKIEMRCPKCNSVVILEKFDNPISIKEANMHYNGTCEFCKIDMGLYVFERT